MNRKSFFIELIKKEKNDLETISSSIQPEIKKIISFLSFQKGCYLSRMTGSGSVCYGLFKDQIYAKKALNKLKIKYPKFWFSIAKTV